MDHDLVVDREITRNGIGQLERRRRHEPAADREQIAVVLTAQVLADRDRPRQMRVDGVARGPGQVVIDLIIDDLALDDPPAVAHVGRGNRASFQPLVIRIVGTERVVELQP